MKKAQFLISICLILLMTIVTITQAQGDTPIEYGQTLTGEITNRNFEVPYVFSGAEGDVIVVEMAAVDRGGDLDRPDIILLDGEGELLADTSESYSFGEILLATILPADGEYIILATRADGRAGESVGEYTLRLLKPPVLNVGEPIEDTAINTTSNFYTVISDGSALAIAYDKSAGEFFPQVSINRINEEYGLSDVVSMSGEEFEKGQIYLPAGEGVYIITVSEAAFDFNFEDVQADYTLELVAGE